MATFDKTGGAPTAGTVPYSGLNKFFVATNTVDLTGTALTAADVYQVLAIPANTHVFQVKVIMVTPAVGTAATGHFGDGSDADGWDASVDLKGAAATVTGSAVGTDAYAAAAGQGTFYATADSIDMTVATATAITAGPKFKISALCASIF